jgi:pectinesterase
MKKKIFLITLLMFVLKVQSQNFTGLTGITDTSFNLPAELRKNIKNYPFISIVPVHKSDSVKVLQDVVYKKIGEQSLTMDIFMPGKHVPSKHIAILFIHGGGWRAGNKSLHHALAQKLASIGYTCFTPAYRLSTEALYPAAVLDIKSSIRWVRSNAKHYHIDKNKIVVGGHSAGGQLAAFMGSTNDDPTYVDSKSTISDRVNAVINVDGILAFIHPESGEGDDSKKPSAGTLWFGYTKNERPDIWNEASPLSHVNENASPMLFFNSSVSRMHAGRTDYINILSKYNISSEVVSYDNAPHSFLFFNPWFDPMVKKIDEFIREILLKK